jgi:hypothetical protein
MKKALLILASLSLYAQAAMVGDFSPMDVGNRWVYHHTYYIGDLKISDKYDTITITGKLIARDSIFYMVTEVDTETAYSVSTTRITQKYLEFNGKNYLYDSITGWTVPEQYFRYNQLPDSIVKNSVYLNQNLFLYDSIYHNSYTVEFDSGDVKWLQNYGLIMVTKTQIIFTITVDSTILISFNGQPFDFNGITGTKSHNISPAKPIWFKYSENKISFENLSENDRLNVRIYDFLGKLLFSRQQAPGNAIFSINRFPQGVYIVRYQKNQEDWERSSIIKK